MMTAPLRKLLGRVTFSLEGGLYEMLLNDSALLGLGIQNIRATSVGVEGSMPARNYPKIHKLARKYRCRAHIVAKSGYTFSLVRIVRKRKGILLGAVLFFVLCGLFQNYVWKIDFYNLSEADQSALQAQLIIQDVTEGTRAEDATLRRAEQNILLNCPQFAWVSLNFVKGRLVVEASDAALKPDIEQTVLTDIVAKYDGRIILMEVYKGNAVKKAGEEVKAGETLVSSVRVGARSNTSVRMPSDAKVVAEVQRVYSASTPLTYTVQAPTGEKKQYLECKIFGRRFPLYKNLPSEEGYLVQTAVYPVSFLGFGLPASMREINYLPYKEQTVTLSQEGAKAFCEEAIKKQLYEDYTPENVISEEEAFEVQNGELCMTVTVTGYMDIAKTVPAAG